MPSASVLREIGPETAAPAPGDPGAASEGKRAARTPPPVFSPGDRRGPFRPHTLAPARLRMRGKTAARAFRLADFAILGGLAAYVCAVATPGGLAAARAADAGALALTAAFAVGAAALMHGYDFGPRESFVRHLVRIAASLGLTGLVLLAVLSLVGPIEADAALSRWFQMAVGAFMALHAVWWLMVERWRRQGRLSPNIIIVGANANAEKLIDAALKTGDIAILGIFDDRLARAPRDIRGVPVLGDTEALLGHRIMPAVDRVVITVTGAARSRVRDLIARLAVLPNEVSLLVDIDGEAARAAAVSRIADWSLNRVSGHEQDERKALLKRAQDIVVGTAALICAAPIMLAVAIAIKMDSPGPVFFRQRRHGFNNEAIRVWKFRSMRHEAADATASRQITADDDRVTKVGKFIRKTSLDELPQIFNVLKGEMSLVGPRPHAIGMKTGDVESERLVAEYAHRHRMKPGMTGWAAVNGSRGPVDTPDLVKRRVQLDVDYIERQSFWLDMWIMAITIPCLLGDRDAVR
jgi:Undecaprenyl-phosphate glucose phosphotransferase